MVITDEKFHHFWSVISHRHMQDSSTVVITLVGISPFADQPLDLRQGALGRSTAQFARVCGGGHTRLLQPLVFPFYTLGRDLLLLFLQHVMSHKRHHLLIFHNTPQLFLGLRL